MNEIDLTKVATIGPQGQKGKTMRTLGFLLISVLMLIVGSVANAQKPTPSKDNPVINSQEVRSVFLENDSLVVRESRETMRVEGVPQGISADTALKLVNGSIPSAETIARPEPVKNTYFFSPRLLKVEREYVASTIQYRGGWIVDHRTIKTDDDDVFLTLLGLWLPLFLIVLISIRNALWGIDWKSLALLYFLFALICIVGSLTNILTGLWVGALLGAIAGSGANRKCIDIEFPLPVGGFPGSIAGCLIGLMSGLFATNTRPKDPMLYLVFVLGASLLAFVVAFLVDRVKKKFEEPKQAS